MSETRDGDSESLLSLSQHMLQAVSETVPTVTGVGCNSTPLIGGCGIRRVSVRNINRNYDICCKQLMIYHGDDTASI